ncbi:HepT-like ribonuclease domain-containing protein [Cellulomonas sp. NPDC089187]|uniref:HepT-like ribonuclease domain-containing protein n=1 Tax=Cellulomonas sp. NPDC089187 TaxID=3154970 RepID=UPI0034271767
MTRDPALNLGLALDHLALLEGYRVDPTLVNTAAAFDAVCMRLQASIEAASRVPREWLEEEFGDRWPHIRGLRNVIAHTYEGVDDAVVRDVVERQLPLFAAGLHRLIDRHAPGLEPELP